MEEYNNAENFNHDINRTTRRCVLGGKKDMGGKAIEKKMRKGFPIFLFGVGRRGG